MGPLSTRVIELAHGYVGSVEVGNNDAPWLQDLMAKSGNPDHWKARESYCIAALEALFEIASKELSIPFPLKTSLSTRGFYEDAKHDGWTKNGPHPLETYEPGDIAIFSDGATWMGHAALVTHVTAKGLFTIEFNTSDNDKGSQRNGGGCFEKSRPFSQFAAPSIKYLWLRGAVKTSRL